MSWFIKFEVRSNIKICMFVVRSLLMLVSYFIGGKWFFFDSGVGMEVFFVVFLI